MASPLPAKDLDHILRETEPCWNAARDARIFVTGGTGFFGCWMLESFCLVNRARQLGARAVVLTRDPGRFREKVPHLVACPEIEVIAGDLRTLAPAREHFDYAIHLATETGPGRAAIDPRQLFESNVEGTRRFLAIVRTTGVRRFLFASSGAVYGPQPPTVALLTERQPFALDSSDPRFAYGESKRVGELLCASECGRPGGVAGSMARCFAFVGPHLPLDANYAVGNFIRDALGRGPIRIEGDGTPRRSYLYAADLAAWLWTILFRGRAGEAYNVGSEEHLSIRDVAEEVRRVIRPDAPIEVARESAPGGSPDRYVPGTGKALVELGLCQKIPFRCALERTAEWYAVKNRIA